MEKVSELSELASEVTNVKVDGERAEFLGSDCNTLRVYETAEEIAEGSGISTRDSPKYSGLHNHCQYSRTC